ncbi:hypothetical protein AB0K87_36445, partial [Streptomyces sp. NPDC053705]
HFLDLGKDFAENVPKPKSTSTASEEYEKKKLDAAHRLRRPDHSVRAAGAARVRSSQHPVNIAGVRH